MCIYLIQLNCTLKNEGGKFYVMCIICYVYYLKYLNFFKKIFIRK